MNKKERLHERIDYGANRNDVFLAIWVDGIGFEPTTPTMST